VVFPINLEVINRWFIDSSTKTLTGKLTWNQSPKLSFHSQGSFPRFTASVDWISHSEAGHKYFKSLDSLTLD
jgi:hypothetical protein